MKRSGAIVAVLAAALFGTAQPAQTQRGSVDELAGLWQGFRRPRVLTSVPARRQNVRARVVGDEFSVQKSDDTRVRRTRKWRPEPVCVPRP